MCDNLDQTLAELAPHGVGVTRPTTEQGWGKSTTIRIPGGPMLGLYEPRHPTALAIAAEQASTYNTPSQVRP